MDVAEIYDNMTIEETKEIALYIVEDHHNDKWFKELLQK